MSETVAIILRFRKEDAEQFESEFKTDVYSLCVDHQDIVEGLR